jgi:hypothetical protein
MKQLMSSNVFELEGTVIICGSCLPNMDPSAFNKLKHISNNIFFTCLEETHMNMVAHKIASVLRLGKVKNLIMVSVNKSPHCVQLHYMRYELEKIMNLRDISVISYTTFNGNLVEVSPKTISLSKNLVELQKLRKNTKS